LIFSSFSFNGNEMISFPSRSIILIVCGLFNELVIVMDDFVGLGKILYLSENSKTSMFEVTLQLEDIQLER